MFGSKRQDEDVSLVEFMYVVYFHRMPGGGIVGDSSSVVVGLRSMSCVTSIVRAQLLPIVC